MNVDKNSLHKLLEDFKADKVTIDQVIDELKYLPFEDLGFAKLDHHRSLRNGYPEVIFCQGKKTDHIVTIVETMLNRGTKNILATRADREIYESVVEVIPSATYYDLANIVAIEEDPMEKKEGTILVVSGGTADIPVAEEAAITASLLGNNVDRLYDVGVAGIHRLLGNIEKLNQANVIIAVAGMEGALASVVGGLVDRPVIAVPTSVGYGANFDGLSALLTMLNSCASGVAVVNIDNGFGAGYMASTINELAQSN